MSIYSLTGLIQKRIYKKFRVSAKWENFIVSLDIGLSVGFAVTLFTFLLKYLEKVIHFVLKSDYENFMNRPRTTIEEFISQSFLIIVLLLVGGILSGVCNRYFPAFKGSKEFRFGTDAVIKAFNAHEMHLSVKSSLVRTLLASPILIATGGAAGVEGTVAYLGGGIGAMYSQIFPSLLKKRRMLIICGASASIGAVFHAPLGASIYMAEVLYFSNDMDTSFVAHSIIASVVAYAVYIVFFGHHALFQFGKMSFHSMDLVYTLLLSFIVIPISMFFSFFFNFVINRFQRMELNPILKPVVGMLFVGCILVIFPFAGGTGYHYVQQLLNGTFLLRFIPIFIILKIISVSLTVGSGGNGGLFGPSIVVGAMIGGGFAMMMNKMGFTLNTETYIVLGMAAFLSATENTPISSIIMISEITGTYELLIPLSLASVTAFFLGRKSVLYRAQVKSRIESSAYYGKYFDLDELKKTTIYEILFYTADKLPRISMRSNLETVLQQTENTDYIHIFPVYDDKNRFHGLIDTKVIRKDIASGRINNLTMDLIIAEDLIIDDYHYVYSSDYVYDILPMFIDNDTKFRGLENFPVITRNKRFMGVLRTSDLIKHQVHMIRKSRE